MSVSCSLLDKYKVTFFTQLSLITHTPLFCCYSSSLYLLSNTVDEVITFVPYILAFEMLGLVDSLVHATTYLHTNS